MAARITLLCDGVALADGGGAFGLVPRPKWVRLLPPDDQNRVPQALWSVLIEADGQRMLIDTGAGDKSLDKLAAQYALQRPHGSLIDDLARHGLGPEDIDVVIQTHLHGDHCGWATSLAGDGALVPTFARARYLVQAREYADATHTNERTRNTYFPENFVPLCERGILTLLDGPATISDSVRLVATPGHTAGHQSVVITGVTEVRLPGPDGIRTAHTAPRTLVMLGDLACYMVHFARLAWVTAYDVLPLTTIDTKRELQSWVLDEAALVIAAHDSIIPIGELTRDAKGFVNIGPAKL